MTVVEQAVYESMLKDLSRSGLDSKDAKHMCVRPVTPTSMKKLVKQEAAGYEIPYFDLTGKVNCFSRYKFTDEVVDKGTGKLWKYTQPKGTGVHAYFPPPTLCAGKWTWADVKADPKVDLIITEGEKKAAAAVKFLRLPCIGLGGVWSWGSRGQKHTLIDSLVPFMNGRRILICFDNDAVPNPHVDNALHALARVIRHHGGHPFAVRLPSLKAGEKAGLDDYLVANGREAFDKLVPVPFDDLVALENLNKELCIITDKVAVYHLPSRTLYSKLQTLATIAYGDRTMVKYDMDGKQKQVNTFIEWSKWPGKRTAKSLVYAPGQPETPPDGSFNVWKGWGVKPAKGDVTPFMELLDQVFHADVDGRYRKWFLQWLAYPLQHPGVKLYTGVLMFSTMQGVGKSLLAETMRPIYGDNFKGIRAQNIHDSFNEWAKHKQFILGDEVTGRDKREDVAFLNNLITQEYVTINAKFQVEYELRDCANIYLTTNNPDALSLDAKDRRWFVWEISDQIHPEAWYTQNYDPWFKNKTNAAAIFDYLLHINTNGFDPRGAAPMTDAKAWMIGISGSFIDYAVRELVGGFDGYVMGSKRDLWTVKELTSLLQVHNPRSEFSLVAVARALRRNPNIKQLSKTRCKRGVIDVLFAMRNVDKWERASHAERSAHMDSTVTNTLE